LALMNLRHSVGRAVESLNTMVVGLDAVEKGHEKPPGLDISWQPADRIASARKSRKFLLEAVLIRAADALNEYVSAILMLPRFKELKQDWNGLNLSMAERLARVSEEVLKSENYHVPVAALLIHWRNRIVHFASSATLKRSQRQLLRKYEVEIGQRYADISVDRLMCHFEESRPTLKDVSTMISMTLNWAKEFDRHICDCTDLESLSAWLDYYNLEMRIEKIKRETKPEKIEESIRRMFRAQARGLEEPYFKLVWSGNLSSMSSKSDGGHVS